MANAMTAEQIFDVIGVRFDPAAFGHRAAIINWHFTDLDEDHVLGIGRSAVHHTPRHRHDQADVSVSLSRQLLVQALDDPGAIDEADIVGDHQLVTDLLASLEIFTTAALIEP